MNTKTLLTSTLGLACSIALVSISAYAQSAGTPTDVGKATANPNTPKSGSMQMNSDMRYKADFEAMDTNHDGNVSRDEFMKYQETNWSRMDSSNNGGLTIKQYQKYWVDYSSSATDGTASTEGVPKLSR
jgi:EF hand